MTMLDMTCDVCLVRPAVRVASTSIPFSCAYCAECATHGLDPWWVMVYQASMCPVEHLADYFMEHVAYYNRMMGRTIFEFRKEVEAAVKEMENMEIQEGSDEAANLDFPGT